MGARHGFSPVPRWRIRGTLGVALAAALVAETFVGMTAAQAVPAREIPAQEERARTPEGVLEAPDIASAKTIARLEGERVEVVGERTITSTTWANPDGTLTTGQATAPIWVPTGEGDGTSSADWAEVDLTLAVDEDGEVRPKAHPADLVLAGAGDRQGDVLVAMDGEEGQTVGLQWTGDLPEPRLEGPRAVYEDVQPGVDLVVEVTRTGYEQFFLLTDRPQPGALPDLSLTVVGEGLAAAETDDGSVSFTDASGSVVGSAGTPLVWDAAVDGERMHPLGEKWTQGREADTALAPQPDWGLQATTEEPGSPPSEPVTEQPAPIAAGPEAPLPLPREDTPVDAGDGAGQVTSAAAAKAGASSALPLTEAVEVTAPGVVDVTLAPDAEFLQDPATQYPVVVDPDWNWQFGFDTWVQHGFGTDQSGSVELRIGTFDGGASVARSFINWDLSSIRYKTILSARLSLWEWHSWSCSPRNWQVWSTDPANHGTRINAQPRWWGHWSSSSQTTGYSTACNDGWVSADVTSLIQTWSNQGAGYVGMGIKAENESDNFGWKKFSSDNSGGGVPTLYVHWNTTPGKADNLRVAGAPLDGDAYWSPTTTPQLQANVHDADGSANVLFQVWENGGGVLWEGWANNVPDGWTASTTVPAGKLRNGGSYSFIAHTHDGVEWNREHSGFSRAIHVDTEAPPAPTVTSTDYPGDGKWYGGAGQAGSFNFSIPYQPLAGYDWGLNQAPSTRVTTNWYSHAVVTPPTNGRHVFQVVAVDKAGNRSPVTKYGFNVGRAGLVSPVEGAQVVRRTRLAVQHQPGFTHIKYEWRRGPDSAVHSDIPLGALSRANGRPMTGTWTSLADVGDYASWDAGLTLGHVPGPAQVRAVLATDAQGAGAYVTQWVTLTVSPDAGNAATDQVGPGEVNLLTGDYTLSSTDVDEFGLAIGRAASSRDPRAGLEPMADVLTATQQSMSAVDEFVGASATLSRVTNRGHVGMDSLRVAASGAGNDSYAQVTMPELRKGATYRVSGWIYVPAATGLTPDHADWGLKLVPYWQDGGGTWRQAPTPRPARTDMWQHLSVDFTIPADARTGGLLRLYNGFAAAGKEVFFDQLSVRELWSPLGPEWSLGVADEIAGTAYSHVSQPYPDVATLHLAGGGEIWFTASGDGRWWPEPGAEGMTLVGTAPGQWRLSELDGTVSTFAVQPGASNSGLVTTAAPAAAGQTRAIYKNENGRVRLHRLIAPPEPGVGECNLDVPSGGCEVAELLYGTGTRATAEAFGSFPDRVSEIRLWSSATGDAAQTSAVTAVQYAYDTDGRLREVWDPRVKPKPLKTTYQYDASGRVTRLTTPGEVPWSFTYGTGGARSEVGDGDLVDRSSGRLLRVERASLAPGSIDQTGPINTSTVVYNVPLNRTAGGPYDLDPDSLAAWAQKSAPTDATAIFGPETVPTVTTATASEPGRDGYRPATVHYLDASGRAVNTASPSGPGAPAAGYIDTAEYDNFGNVVRTLDAANRLLALGQGPTAEADLKELKLELTPADTRALLLSTVNEYAHDGIDLLKTRGPLLRLAVGNDPTNVWSVHDVTTYAYDEGKPDGAVYHLVTTQTDAVDLAGFNTLADVVVTKNEYGPQVSGDASGWVTGQPTKVIHDAGDGGAKVAAVVRYDAQGRVVESRKAGSTGADAGTTRAIYYTAGSNPRDAACGLKPGWAGLPCKTVVAADVTGHDPARMAGKLPERMVTGYNRYGSITSVTEAASGPVNGAPATQTRTTTTTYDEADRVTSVSISATGAGTAAAPMPTTVNTYDENTGHVVAVTGKDPVTGADVSVVRKTFDWLGRVTRYDDGSGGWTTSVFDRFGKPVTVTESTGATTTFTYDRAKEPRGFVTSVNDSVAGTMAATYGADGELLTQSMPGGVELRVRYDANRSPVSRTYVRTSDGKVVSSSTGVENSAGQVVTHTTLAGSKTFTYDRLGRLTDAKDAVVGLTSCTWRQYGYNVRAGRTSLRTSVSPTTTCVDPSNAGSTPVTANSYTYDSADRLVSEAAVDAGAWVYDPLGRITSAPVRGSPGKRVVNGFYANDMVASQTIEGVARQTWSLDAIGRFSSYRNEAWATGATGPGWQEAVTKVNHYDSDSDSPAWISEDASLPDEITRYVDGLDGNLAVQTGKTGARVLQLVDLHGDVMTTLPIRDGASAADWAQVRQQASDEFGNRTDLTTGAAVVTDGRAPGKEGRYGWLGGKQRSADALAGVILMGARMYDPATGRFWSVDPVPGGNATAYDYCAGDPVNCVDLDGQWGFFKKLVKNVAKKVAKVAEIASNIPGPIGSLSAAVSAGAYAVTGNKKKAIEMGITVAAAMIPGGGAAVKAGFAMARAGGRVASKVGQGVNKLRKGSCNSFTPETGVLMADGTTQPISDVQPGELVAARDPVTGELTAQPVLDVIVGHGDKHLIGVTTSRAPPAGADEAATLTDEDTWVATANHPIWVAGRGWTDADDLRVGDRTIGATGDRREVTSVVDYGWQADRTVYNLSVANVHTYIVGSVGDGSIAHNASCAVNRGIYVVTDKKTGLPYVGMSINIDRRLARHVATGKITYTAAKAAERFSVKGKRRIDLRVAEQREIQRRGGLAATANKRNEIARRNWGRHGIR